MANLFIDFETRSRVDLKKRGLGPYASDPSTDFWCMAYAFDDEPVDIVVNYDGEPAIPTEVFDHVKNGGTVVAHNAQFEWNIWNKVCAPKYGWPHLLFGQLDCTMVRAYAMAIPASLEKAALALGLNYQKDMKGHRAMMKFCAPDPRTGEFRNPFDEPEVFEAILDYCKQDLEVERELSKRLFKLSPTEQKLWVLDQQINEYGLGVDTNALSAAILLVETEKDRLDSVIRDITNGAIPTCSSVARIVDFLRDHGMVIDGVAKADVLDALKLGDELPIRCKRVLELRKEAAKSSTAKIEAMLNRAHNKRINNTLQFHGANTGRWAGRGVQLQNFPRGSLKDSEIEFVFNLLKEVESETGPN